MNQYVYFQSKRLPIVSILACLLILFSILYAFFLQQTARQVVERQELNDEIAALRSDIGDAEFNYGSSISEVTREKARSLGYESIHEPKFVTRTDRGTMVTVNVQN